jgi:hypothetical protein
MFPKMYILLWVSLYGISLIHDFLCVLFCGVYSVLFPGVNKVTDERSAVFKRGSRRVIKDIVGITSSIRFQAFGVSTVKYSPGKSQSWSLRKAVSCAGELDLWMWGTVTSLSLGHCSEDDRYQLLPRAG